MGAVVKLEVPQLRRYSYMAIGDCLTNNTDSEIMLREETGSLIALLRPGNTYESDKPQTVRLDVAPRIRMNIYINEEKHDGVIY